MSSSPLLSESRSRLSDVPRFDLQHFRLGELLFGHRAVQADAVGRGIEFQLPADEHHTRVAIRGGLTVNLPPPSGPPVYPEGGTRYEEGAVVMVAVSRAQRGSRAAFEAHAY
jgi:hypothetical protein